MSAALRLWFFAAAVAAAAAALPLLAGCGGERPAVVAVGAPVPDYAATTIAGDSVALADLQGKVVLLNVWATWCHPCREELPDLQRLHGSHAGEGLRIVGVSVDTRGEEENIRRFAARYGVTYPIWLDPEQRVSSIFRTVGVPSTFLIGRDGTLLWKHVGPVQADDPVLRHLLENALRDRTGS